MAELPTGTVTFLFTDIAGSTALLQRLGPDYARVLGEHQQLLRAAFAANGGAEVDTQGDAFFVAFPSAPLGVAAAAEATRALAAHQWPESGIVQVRMGLHTGAPALVGDHYVGLDVHRAARIAAAGHGGQILLSAATRELVRNALPAGSRLRDLGAYRLKDLQQPEHIAQLDLADMPSDFPPLKTLDLHQHNLPIQPTPLLGREEQVAAACALLGHEDVRLLTLTGPGGIGKTRLSIQVAAELVDAFADGVYFVRLSRLTDPALVVPTIAHTLGLRESGSQSLSEQLREHLASKQLLLALDNFEQVVAAATEVAGLLASCPELKVLVTSRLALRLRAEHEYALAPLPLPDAGHLPPPERFSQYAAVALFVERAQAAKASFVVTASNAPAIAAICARLDGLPLAIELAAARVKLLPVEALLARLSVDLPSSLPSGSAGLGLLAGGARDLEERQQTMRATIAWSETLLAPMHQALFRRLAVFAGSCTLEAAEVVCLAPHGVDPLPRELDLLDGLQTLVEHSLVQEREEGSGRDGGRERGAGGGGGGDGEPRFGLLHIIREYALERLEASGEGEALREAHAAWALALAERAEPELTGPYARAWLDQLEREHDNLRAALGWARERRQTEMGLRLAGALGRFWWIHGHLSEGRGWLESLLELATPEEASVELRARALSEAGALAGCQGDFARAQPLLEHAMALYQECGNVGGVARALNSLAGAAYDQDDLSRAAALFEQSVALARQVGEPGEIARTLGNLGEAIYHQGDLERAAVCFTEALALARQSGHVTVEASQLCNLGAAARKRGDLAQATLLQRQSLDLKAPLGNRRQVAMSLEQLAAIAAEEGQGERAARLLGATAALREAVGAPLPPAEWAEVQQATGTARSNLGAVAWAAAYAAGQALSLEAAIALALGKVEWEEVVGGDERTTPGDGER